MPQKKNPDSLELIRGRSGTVLGKLTGMLAVMKGLPLAYNRDLQEDKAALFSGVDTTLDALIIAGRVAATMRIRPERMKAMTQLGFLTATDLADELVRRGIPFADAHEQVGKLVRHCADEGQDISGFVRGRKPRKFVPGWDSDLHDVATSMERSVARRNVTGGTAPKQVARQICPRRKTCCGITAQAQMR